MRPKIGYTTRNYSMDPLQIALHISIWIAGGVPIRLRPISPKYDRPIDGLVIGGGTDLFPTLYKQDPKPDYKYDHERDKMEIRWLEKADNDGLPILGICRGAQLMNVRRGGSLHIDISKVYENAKYPSHILARIFFRKTILMHKNTLLWNIVGQEEVRVNSMHKQAIDQLGRNLVISAKEQNDVVQAIEDPAKKYFIGVQFHPEALIYQRKFRRIFKRLIEMARPEGFEPSTS